MIIAFVSDAVYPYNKGGKEKRLYELSTRLVKLGHEVHIYTMHWWKTPEKERTEHGVTLHAISKYHDMYNGDTRSIKEGLLFGLACFRVWGIKADVIDVDHMPFFPIYSAWIVLTLRGKKLYGTWHEALSRKDWTDYMGQLGNVSYVIEHLSIKLPFHISAASAHTQRQLASIHGRSRGVSLVTPGINTKLIKSVKPIKLNIDILYIGRLVKDKNVDTLIRAVDIMVQQGTDVQCIIIGHGVEKQNLTSLIKKLKLTDHVDILEPRAEDTEIYAYMKAARVFCLPSVREGFGMVVLEALGCGTPVITTDSQANASRDLITEGVNGSVVPVTSQAIATAATTWLSKPKPKNLEKQVASYDWDKIAKHQAEVYAV